MPDAHLSQQLARLGARIIFHAVNGGRDGSAWSTGVVWQFHESNLRMRAVAGRVWIVTVDNCAPIDLPCSAPCGVINPSGEWAVKTESQGERLFVQPAGFIRPALQPGDNAQIAEHDAEIARRRSSITER